MSPTTLSIIVGLILLAIFIMVAKLAIRWAIRVVIVGAILIALLGVGGFWWWTNRLAPKPHPLRPTATPTRRTPT
jgi:O-antigen/teichoic acid export membrane protein